MAAEEHQHDTPQPAPGNQGLRAAWLGPRRIAVMAGVVAVGLLAGAGVAFATTGSPARPVTAATATTPSPSPSSPSAQVPHRQPFPLGRGLGGAFGPGFPFGMGGMFGAVHGQYVAAKPGGGYQTIDFQNGKVTAVSGTSITLRSPDGYVHSYVVTGSTTVDAQRGGISSVKVGHEVSVQATVSGSTATAARIADLTLLQAGAKHFFGSLPHGHFKMTIP
jgi:hypothetical protein